MTNLSSDLESDGPIWFRMANGLGLDDRYMETMRQLWNKKYVIK